MRRSKKKIKVPGHWPLWGEVTRKMFPFEDVVILKYWPIPMKSWVLFVCKTHGPSWKTLIMTCCKITEFFGKFWSLVYGFWELQNTYKSTLDVYTYVQASTKIKAILRNWPIEVKIWVLLTRVQLYSHASQPPLKTLTKASHKMSVPPFTDMV